MFVAAILNILCQHFLRRNVSAILFLSNSETYGRETASAQYFMQLADYLRIPVIAWNAGNAGLERVGTITSESCNYPLLVRNDPTILPAPETFNANDCATTLVLTMGSLFFRGR